MASDTQLTATVPPDAATGAITVTTSGGSATSAASFTVTAAPVGAKVTLTLSGLRAGTVRLGRIVTASGALTPAGLAGSSVTLRVEMKKGATWLKVKTTSVRSRPEGTYMWKYEPRTKGTYRMRASIVATAAYPAATTAWRGFKVK